MNEIGSEFFFPFYFHLFHSEFFFPGLVVVDEIHMVGEGKRGATLETLLCKLLLSSICPRMIAMSATIGNIDELSNFLKVNDVK